MIKINKLKIEEMYLNKIKDISQLTSYSMVKS